MVLGAASENVLEMQITKLYQDLLNQKRKGWMGPAVCVWTSPAGDSDALQVFRLWSQHHKDSD